MYIQSTCVSPRYIYIVHSTLWMSTFQVQSTLCKSTLRQPMFCTVYNRYHGWSGCNGIHYCRYMTTVQVYDYCRYMTTVYLLPYNVLYCFIRSNRDRIGFYAEIQIICMLQAAELGLADRLYCLAYGPPPVYRYTTHH